MMRRLRTAKGGYIWVGRQCPVTTTVCLISLIDFARRGVRAFVCTIVLPDSPANYVAVNIVNLCLKLFLRQHRLYDVRPIPVIINPWDKHNQL